MARCCKIVKELHMSQIQDSYKQIYSTMFTVIDFNFEKFHEKWQISQWFLEMTWAFSSSMRHEILWSAISLSDLQNSEDSYGRSSIPLKHQIDSYAQKYNNLTQACTSSTIKSHSAGHSRDKACATFVCSSYFHPYFTCLKIKRKVSNITKDRGEMDAHLVSNVTTKACNHIHPESATIPTSSISLFSNA